MTLLRSLFALVALALAPAVLGQQAGAKQSELEALKRRLHALQQEYRDAQSHRREAVDALRQYERAISSTVRQVRELDAERQRAQGDLRSLAERADALATRIRSQQQGLGKVLRAAHRQGQGETLKLLLEGADPNQTARDLRYLGYVSRARRAVIETLRADRAMLAQLEQEAAQETTRLRQLQAAREAEQKRLLADKRARERALEKLAAQIRQQRVEIARLKRDERSLTQLVERLNRLTEQAERARTKQASRGRPAADSIGKAGSGVRSGGRFAALKGALRKPVAGELSNRFGAPREGGGMSWKGLFFRAATGAQVKAVAPGQVVFAEWLRGFGNLLIVDHGEGYMSLYSNNESLYKQVGERVQAGEPVAAVGNSGGQPEPGLYFEMRHQGRPINPLPWMK